ncbi:hypothetical protein [Streptomyces sp. NBC_01615]|uniref:hypothetical protein n=1 Tax=Streptomyces sp. NBC_01615 TaxID=2975898 RepID=UPI003870A59D
MSAITRACTPLIPRAWIASVSRRNWSAAEEPAGWAMAVAASAANSMAVANTTARLVREVEVMAKRKVCPGAVTIRRTPGSGWGPHALSITEATATDGALRLKVKTFNIDRLDVYVDQRPRASIDLPDGQADVTVPGAATARSALLEGFASGRLVVSRTEQLQ